jgi:hypothetical protein
MSEVCIATGVHIKFIPAACSRINDYGDHHAQFRCHTELLYAAMEPITGLE